MRRHIAALLALLAVAAPSFAQTPVGVQSMTPSRTSIGNTSGALWTTDPFVTAITYHPAIVNTGVGGLAPGSALASSALDTRGWKGMAILLYGTPLGAQAQSRYAISVRGSYMAASDTTTSWTWAPWRRPISAGLTGAQPTILPDTVGAWGNGGGSGGNLADGLTSFQKFYVTPGEFVVILNPNDQHRGRKIDLVNPDGSWWMSPYTIVRVRALGGMSNAGTFTTDSTTARVYRADLVRLQ